MDKASKKFLDYLDSCQDHTHIYSRDFPSEFGSKAEVFAMIRYLERMDYIEIIRSAPLNSGVAVRLSHKGIHRREFRRQEVLKYLEDKWIDFFALLISAAAFVISGITLLYTLQS